MTQLVRVDKRATDLIELFKINKNAIIKQAPRTTIEPDRLIRIAFNAIVYDDALVGCTRDSLIGGVMEAVKLGITLGGPMQEGWLIPFKTKKRGTDNYEMTATLIVGFMGYRNIIDRGRAVIDLHPRAVYQGDDFDFNFGVQPTIRHKPYWLVNQEKGALVAVYAVARLRGGGVQLEVMPKEEVDAHRERSRAKNSGPWVTDYDAMALKTVIRKIAKYLPKSTEIMSRALDLDEKADRGEDQEFDLSGLTIPPDDPNPPGVTPGGGVVAALKQTLNARKDEP